MAWEELRRMMIVGEARSTLTELPSQSVQTCVTSPPYWGLRDYGVAGQLGLEQTPQQYVDTMVKVFREVWRVLKDDGTLWLNLGDSYCSPKTGGLVVNGKTQMANRGHQSNALNRIDKRAPGLKEKDLVGIPWRVAFALQAEGWFLRQDIIWHKPNPMPESVRDRCTKAHEYIFLLSKSQKYYFNSEAMKEPVALSTKQRLSQPNLKQQIGSTRVPGKTNGNMKAVGSSEHRNRRSVWTVTTKPFKGAHFATFPPDLIEPCILAGSRPGDTVLDPFAGAGTTGVVCKKQSRSFIGIELNPEYADMARRRIDET